MSLEAQVSYAKPRTAIVTIKVRAGSGSKWDRERMLDLARARDNGKPFYVVESKRSVRDLERIFRQREVAGILEERVGSIVDGVVEDLPSQHHLMQLDLPNDFVTEAVVMCLEEIGVTISGTRPVRFSL